MPPLIEPKVLDDLVGMYGEMNRRDMLSTWLHAVDHWDIADEYRKNEPAAITSARALWVHARWHDFAPLRESFKYSAELLIAPYRRR